MNARKRGAKPAIFAQVWWKELIQSGLAFRCLSSARPQIRAGRNFLSPSCNFYRVEISIAFAALRRFSKAMRGDPVDTGPSREWI